MKKLFVSILLLTVSLSVSAISYPSTSYEVHNGYLDRWLGDETDIDFTADPFLRDCVDEISNEAFAGNTNIKSITISSTVRYISIYAFKGCSNLETVVFSEVGNEDKLTHIDSGAFEDCTSLRSVTFSQYCPDKFEDAFENCSSLTTFKVSSNHPTMRSSGGILYNKDYTTLVAFPPGVTGHHDLRDNVTTIGDYAFYSSMLSTIYLPTSVREIGSDAFSGAFNLTTINFPNGLTSIRSYAFSRCSKLKSLILPSTLTEIGECAFSRCHSLPETIKLPASLASIGGDAFNRCEKVKNFEVAEGNPYLSTIDGVLFDRFGSTLISWPHGREQVEYEVPDGVSHIAEGAFYYSNINHVTLPSSLRVIGEYAFCYSQIEKVVIPEGATNIDHSFCFCEKLVEVELPSTLMQLDRYTFWRHSNAKTTPRTFVCHLASPVGEWLTEELSYDTLYVPEESVDLFAMAPGWRAFGQILPIPEVVNYFITFGEYAHGIIVVAVDGDEVESGVSVLENSVVTVLAIPFNGYELASLTANGATIENNSSFAITESLTIEADFVAIDDGMSAISSDPASVKVYDAAGKQIDSESVKNGSLRKGVYVVLLKDGSVRKVLF